MDDELVVKKYDCNKPEDEPPPVTLISTPAFKELEQAGNAILNQFELLLSRSAFKGPVKEALRREVKDRQPDAQVLNTQFCLVGDMGVGKSTLINSIIGRGTVAKKGDSGNSCTWVVHKYRRQFTGQAEAFEARVRYLEGDEVKKFMQDTLKQWYTAKHLLTADEGTPGPGAADFDEQYTDVNDAVAVLRTLFCNKDDFSSDAKAAAFLSRAESAEDSIIVEELTTQAERLIRSHLKGGTFVAVKATTCRDLLHQLAMYTTRGLKSEQEFAMKPETWPLVTSVEIGLESAILDDGIVLVDLPGSSDGNKVRRARAAECRAACHYEIMVATISRAVDNTSLRSNLSRQFRRKGPGAAIVALTYADQIDSTTTHAGSYADEEAQMNFDLAIRQLERDRERVVNDHADLDPEDRPAARLKIKTIQNMLREQRKKSNALRVRMRSKNVTKALSEHYANMTTDDRPLPIFAIANNAYTAWMRGFTMDEAPDLEPEETGVPGLRNMLRMLPTAKTYSRVMHLVLKRIPELLRNVSLYCNGAHLEGIPEIQNILDDHRLALEQSVKHGISRSLHKAAGEEMIEKMRANSDAWTSRGAHMARNWINLTLDPAFFTLMKRKGIRKGRQRPLNWNAELLHVNKKEIESWEGLFFKEAERAFQRSAETAKNLSKAAADKIKDTSKCSVMVLRDFVQQFESEQEQLEWVADEERAIFRERASYENELRIIEETMADLCRAIFGRLTYHDENNFVFQAMCPVYEEVARLKGGRGAPQRRKDHFAMLLSRQTGVWASVCEQVRAALMGLLHETIVALTGRFMEVNNSILRSFSFMCDSHKTQDEETKVVEDVFRNSLDTLRLQIVADLEGPVQALVEECRKQEAQCKQRETLE